MKKEDLIQIKEFLSIDISSIGVNHLNQCVELDKISLDGLWSREQWIKELTDKDRKCFGIFIETRMIAFACGWIVLDELQVTAIAVHPKERRIGQGKRILSYLLNQAKLNGAKKAILEVKSNNFSAQSLYEKIGFIPIGIRKKFYKDRSDAIIFCCDLTNKEFIKK